MPHGKKLELTSAQADTLAELHDSALVAEMLRRGYNVTKKVEGNRAKRQVRHWGLDR
jgi:hypothetical protein